MPAETECFRSSVAIPPKPVHQFPFPYSSLKRYQLSYNRKSRFCNNALFCNVLSYLEADVPAQRLRTRNTERFTLKVIALRIVQTTSGNIKRVESEHHTAYFFFTDLLAAVFFAAGFAFLANAPGTSASINFFTCSNVSTPASSAVERVPSAFFGIEMIFLPNLMTGPQRAFSKDIFSSSQRCM